MYKLHDLLNVVFFHTTRGEGWGACLGRRGTEGEREREGGRVGQRERGREAECLTQSESSWVEGTLVSRTSVLVHCHTAQF